MNRHWKTVLFTGLTVLAMNLSALAAGEDAKAPELNIGGVDKPGGVIKGIVKYEGKTPPRQPIQMAADKYCAGYHAANKPGLSELWVFGKNGDQDVLQNVFVYVSKGLEGKTIEPPKTPATIDQHGCQYHPHVQGIMVNQPLKILNSDPTLHNVQALPRPESGNAPFNDGMPVKGMVLNKSFAKPEMGLLIKCAVHPWMTAYLCVMEHPYYAVTQGDGTFEIRGLPDGQYEISTWHEFRRFAPDKQSVLVTVSGGKASTDVTVTYAPKKR